MRIKKEVLSRNCQYCGAKFKTTNRRKIYHHPYCGKYAWDRRQIEKVRKAQEILRQQAGL